MPESDDENRKQETGSCTGKLHDPPLHMLLSRSSDQIEHLDGGLSRWAGPYMGLSPLWRRVMGPVPPRMRLPCFGDDMMLVAVMVAVICLLI